jgi:hypothetical protein
MLWSLWSFNRYRSRLRRSSGDTARATWSWSTPLSPHPPNTSDAVAAGLYLATTRQLRFNPFGSPGSASWEVATEFYLLSRDGRVFRGRDLPSAPDGDISRFDYDAARREAPGNYGTYTVRGNQVIMQLGDAPHETITATRSEPDVLDIRGTKFTRSIRERPGA